jgi:kinetochore protein Spc7/SPC105
MDMTTIINSGNYPATGLAILDEEFDYEDDNEDMDLTEAIQGNSARKRSSSIGRPPLFQVQSLSANDGEVDEPQSDNGSESMEQSSEELSQGVPIQSWVTGAMEFTVPLGQSLRPAAQDAAWVALKQMTHSGEEVPEPTSDDSVQYHEEDGMGLEDAMNRLRHARDSLPLSSQPLQSSSAGQLDDTFTSTEDSFEGDDDDGNKTLNLSQVVGRLSIGTNARMSIGYQDSNMDESEVYGNIAESTPGQSQQPQPRSNTPQESEPAPIQQMISSVFQPPPITSAASTSSVFTRPISPSKVKQVASPTKLSQPKPTFSAAFAPPVARSSPKKSVASPARIPAKRPRTTNEDVGADADRPSPAKKPVLADKWMEITAAREEARKSLVSKPKSLSPSKKAIFLKTGGPVTAKPASGTKRPSGYFARRKSLAPGLDQPSANQPNLDPTPSTPRKANVDSRRRSVGSVPSAAQQFDRLASRNQSSKSDFVSNGQNVRETLNPSPVPVILEPAQSFQRGPGHAPPPQDSEVFEQPAAPILVVIPPIEETSIVSEGTEIDVGATQQWRDAVQQDDYIDQDQSVGHISSSCNVC